MSAGLGGKLLEQLFPDCVCVCVWVGIFTFGCACVYLVMSHLMVCVYLACKVAVWAGFIPLINGSCLTEDQRWVTLLLSNRPHYKTAAIKK